tara:strand:+ start:192 stop:356 length:165 start_codon:yes stop_codon:yes gene_type:complete
MSKKKFRKKDKKIPMTVSVEWELCDRNELWEKLWDRLILYVQREWNEGEFDGRR